MSHYLHQLKITKLATYFEMTLPTSQITSRGLESIVAARMEGSRSLIEDISIGIGTHMSLNLKSKRKFKSKPK